MYGLQFPVYLHVSIFCLLKTGHFRQNIVATLDNDFPSPLPLWDMLACLFTDLAAVFYGSLFPFQLQPLLLPLKFMVTLVLAVLPLSLSLISVKLAVCVGTTPAISLPYLLVDFSVVFNNDLGHKPLYSLIQSN